MAYYENPSMLTLQQDWLTAMREEVRAALHWVVVDDGSPERPAKLMTAPGLASQRLYRMKQDVPWNQDACRNLGVKLATSKWVFLTDIDHLVPEETLVHLMSTRLPQGVAFQFERQTLASLASMKLEPYKHHPNTWYMRKTLYEAIGGYDERFAGYYGTDGDFRDRLASVAPIVRLKQFIIRVPREVVPDASTTTLARRSPENTAGLLRIKRERDASAPWRPMNGMFEWEEE